MYTFIKDIYILYIYISLFFITVYVYLYQVLIKYIYTWICIYLYVISIYVYPYSKGLYMSLFRCRKSWVVMTRIFAYYPSSVSARSSDAQKRIVDSSPRVLSPGGGLPNGLDAEALTDLFLLMVSAIFGFFYSFNTSQFSIGRVVLILLCRTKESCGCKTQVRASQTNDYIRLKL